jgi:hypothetical protein
MTGFIIWLVGWILCIVASGIFHEQINDVVGAPAFILAGLLWPILLPIGLLYLLGKWIRSRFDTE